jgi:asparagine synthase (glutamine-hydrolysing)
VCGLNGIVYRDSAPPESLSLIRRMNSTIAHRGPDGEGTWSDEHAVLGHRRLSIIDLSEHGRQPMLSTDGALVLVCNGEIYNYRELRSRLAAEGYRFQSDTDVEVIFPLYERHGERCVDYLVGMFAFALWDRRFGRLLLARDRIGEKPLYFSVTTDWLAFSSEPKGLLALPFVDRRLNPEAVPLLLVHQSLPAPVTMFCGIEQLPPASYGVWERGSLRRTRYWQLDFTRQLRLSDRDAVSAYEDVLGRSVVDSQMASDVPVGLMLSGGVDSSTIAALAVRRDRTISSFCVGTTRDGRDDIEIQRADQVARALRTDHHALYYNEPDLSCLPELIAQYDQPLWCLPILYADRLAQRMRQQVKVVLTGNGADEAFGGYSGYARLPLQEAMAGPGRMLPLGAARLLGSRASKARRFLDSVHLPMAARRGRSMTVLAQETMRHLCQPAFANRWSDYEAGRFATAAAEECNPRSLFDAVRYADLMVCHQHGHCVIPDISGMTHGLEMRSPFLDHRVLEFAAALPQRHVLPFPYRSRDTKLVTKRFLERLLPRDIVYARKVGFGYGVSFSAQLTGAESLPVRKRLLTGRYLELDIFSRQGAEWALANSPSMVSMLVCFSLWADQHVFGGSIGSFQDRDEKRAAG